MLNSAGPKICGSLWSRLRHSVRISTTAWLQLFGRSLYFINAHELLAGKLSNANEHISFLQGHPLTFHQVNSGCSYLSQRRGDTEELKVFVGGCKVSESMGRRKNTDEISLFTITNLTHQWCMVFVKNGEAQMMLINGKILRFVFIFCINIVIMYCKPGRFEFEALRILRASGPDILTICTSAKLLLALKKLLSGFSY